MLSEERKTQLFLQADSSLELLHTYLRNALDETIPQTDESLDADRSFICCYIGRLLLEAGSIWLMTELGSRDAYMEIGRASCRERV